MPQMFINPYSLMCHDSKKKLTLKFCRIDLYSNKTNNDLYSYMTEIPNKNRKSKICFHK